jgi:hypothetical protein
VNDVKNNGMVDTVKNINNGTATSKENQKGIHGLLQRKPMYREGRKRYDFKPYITGIKLKDWATGVAQALAEH